MLDPDQMNLDQRALAETFDGAAQGGSRRLGNGGFDEADRTDRRLCQEVTAAIED